MPAQPLIFKTKEDELQASKTFNKLQMEKWKKKKIKPLFLPVLRQAFYFKESLLFILL